MKIKTSLIIIFISVVLSGCFIGQIFQMKKFADCEFNFITVDNIVLSGINISKIKSISDLSLFETSKLSMSYAVGRMPLTCSVLIEVKNPNRRKAAMNKLAWIVFIDDKELVSGVNSNRIEVAPNGGTVVMPLEINLDLYKSLQGEGLNSLLNLGMNITGFGKKPTNITIKVKPSILIGNKAIETPGYITVKQQFDGK